MNRVDIQIWAIYGLAAAGLIYGVRSKKGLAYFALVIILAYFLISLTAWGGAIKLPWDEKGSQTPVKP